MSCRSTPAGSFATTLARMTTDRTLSDPAVLSVFHEARRTAPEFALQRIEQNPREQYQAALSMHENNLQRLYRNGEITEARYNSLVERLGAARNQETPDARTIYAVQAVTNIAERRARTLRQFINNIATRTETPEADVWTAYRAAEESAPRARGRHAVTVEGHSVISSGEHVANDPGVHHAMNALEESARATEIARAATRMQRVTPADISGTTDETTGMRVTRAGYDPRVGHLVVETVDQDGNTQTHAYRNVSASTYEQMGSGDATSVWAQQVRGNADHQYASAHEAALASVAPRCPNCGQFADASHSCPVPEPTRTLRPWGTQQRWSLARQPIRDAEGNIIETHYEDSIRLPAVRELRNAVAEGPVRIDDLNGYMPAVRGEGGISRTNGSVRGGLTVARAEDGALTVSTAGMRCSCDEYRANGDCVHLRQVAEAVRQRVNPPSRSRASMTPEERERAVAEAQQRAEQAAATDWTRQPESLEDAAATWRRESEVLYSENPEAFRQDVEAAKQAAAAKDGQPDIPYMRENALDGMATRDSGNGFGCEIEFDFPSDMGYQERRDAQAAIARDLYAEGITRSDRQERYGYSRQFGFVDQHSQDDGTGTWCFENDGSVGGGELVTPVMYDEPETWEKLDKAVEIIRRHGGVPSKKAGAHVHVGTGSFNGSPQAYTELARMVTQHEDVMYRMASDPSRGTHRNNGYSKPLSQVPAEGFQDVMNMRRWQSQRYSAVNFAHVQGASSDHPEFRLFDSSLDSGTLQAQVKMAVATVHAAKRNAESGGTTRSKEAWGSHAERAKARGSRRRLTDEEFDADSATTRSMIDTLFRRREDKAQMAAVFANTKWTKPRGR